MNVAEKIADYLAAKGCTHAFGIVGGANLTLFEAISRRLEVVSVNHEQAAAGAAWSYYRASGRIAPCLVTAGGGSVNAFTGVAAANFDSIPLLVISGNEMTKFFAPPRTRNVGFQGFDAAAAVRPFVKASFMADDPQGALLGLDGLYETALKPRQGACWLDIPQDLAAKEAP